MTICMCFLVCVWEVYMWVVCRPPHTHTQIHIHTYPMPHLQGTHTIQITKAHITTTETHILHGRNTYLHTPHTFTHRHCTHTTHSHIYKFLETFTQSKIARQNKFSRVLHYSITFSPGYALTQVCNGDLVLIFSNSVPILHIV